MDKETKGEFNKLGRMIARGFEGVDKRFEHVATKSDVKALESKMDERFSHVNARLDTIERDIAGFVTQGDFEDALGRISYLEGRLGVVSGK